MDKPSDKLPEKAAGKLDRESILIDARRELSIPSRRLFGKQLLSLGGLSLLTGCSLTDDDSVNKFLTAVSRLNDRAQAALFDPKQLAPTYTEAQITRPFPFNAYYGIDEVPQVDASGYTLKIGGLVTGQRVWTLPELYALPHAEQITRHICVEGWSAIGKWTGVRFSDFLDRIGADKTARYVGFKCADDYYSSIDMATALHPQTLLTLGFGDQILPPEYGFPMKLRMPTKLGFKNPKHIMALFVTNTYPGGYWEDQGYNWYSGS
jgi:DMSO/TMAO reductase YedYZ molybdopterin-dependent catalytic subunit